MTILELLLITNTGLLMAIGCYLVFTKNGSSNDLSNILKSDLANLREFLIQKLFQEHLLNTQRMDSNFKDNLEQFKREINLHMTSNNTQVNQQIEKMNTTLYQQLRDVRTHLDNSLTSNLSKSNQAYSDIIKRLSLIDSAQKRISELSSNMLVLQEILSDKQCRGVFGEVQLATIVKNIIPASHFKLQHTLSNGKRADCILELPDPTGKLVIDSKFPLESYRTLSKSSITPQDRLVATKQFKKDIKKHIVDIAAKYIIQDETADCAIMFIPAESVFSEIHAHHPDLVNESFESRVWMVSPTTMMAILNTSSAVIKDLARQKEINLIQKHLNYLSQDFGRFQKRMDALSRHIRLANEDVDNVNASAKKIVSRFDQIENVELQPTLETKNDIELQKECIE